MHSGFEALSVAENEAPKWLPSFLEIWKFYGRKGEFEMIRTDWPDKYSDLVNLLKTTDPTVVEAWPNYDYGTDEKGQTNAVHVSIKPLGLRLLKERPQEVHRQVTVNGKKVDLRNERALMILTPPIENLVTMIPLWVQQLRIEREPRPWRAIYLKLDRLLTYRGHELPVKSKNYLISVLSEYTSSNNGDQSPNANEGTEERERENTHFREERNATEQGCMGDL